MSQRHYTIPVFIPDLACPHQCIYCNQKHISGRIKIPNAGDVAEIVERNLQTIPAGSKVEIGFFGGNFTGVAWPIQKQLLTAAEDYVKKGKVSGIKLSTRPDYINEDILNFLKTFSVRTIELGAQSFDDEVLRLSERGHNAEATIKASQLIKQSGFELGLQMMIGLPGDTLEKSIMTAEKIVELKADSTRIYPVLVIKDTKLEELFREEKYDPLSLEEAVSQAKVIYKIFEEAGISILRVGLHPSDGLVNKEVYVAGPFHVSFRELVLTELWREVLTPLLIDPITTKIRITVAPDQLNYAIGHEGSNKKILQQHFSDVNFITNPLLTARSYHADHC